MRTVRPPVLTTVAGIVCLLAFCVVFQSGFQQYADAYEDRIAATKDPALLQNAMWMDRHAKIVLHDSVFFFVAGISLLLVAIWLARLEKAGGD